MNVKILFALCLILVLVLPDTEGGWGRRRRRRRRRVCTRYCTRFTCVIYGCHWYYGRLRCHYRCRRRCWTRCYGKRDASEPELASDEVENSSSSKLNGMAIPLDYKFSDYDHNKDRRISYLEFKKAMPPVNDEREIKIGFNLVEKNGDKYIDCNEFKVAHLVLDFGRKKPITTSCEENPRRIG